MNHLQHWREFAVAATVLLMTKSMATGAAQSFDRSATHVARPRTSAIAFTNITESAGTGGPTDRGRTGGHGAMFADADGDGRPDLYVTMIFKDPMPERFYRNLGGNRFVEEGDGTFALRQSFTDTDGYMGQNDPVLHFGLGHRESVDVVVTFLNGATIRRTVVGANQMVTVDGRRPSK